MPPLDGTYGEAASSSCLNPPSEHLRHPTNVCFLLAASIGRRPAALLLWRVRFLNVHHAQHDLVPDFDLSREPIHVLITLGIESANTKADLLLWQLREVVAARDPRKNSRNNPVACNAGDALFFSIHMNFNCGHNVYQSHHQ